MTLDAAGENEMQMAFQVMNMILRRTPNVFVFKEEWKQTVVTNVTHQCREQQTRVSGRVSFGGSWLERR